MYLVLNVHHWSLPRRIFFLAPLEVAGTSGDVENLSPLDNGGADLLVHVHVT